MKILDVQIFIELEDNPVCTKMKGVICWFRLYQDRGQGVFGTACWRNDIGTASARQQGNKAKGQEKQQCGQAGWFHELILLDAVANLGSFGI